MTLYPCPNDFTPLNPRSIPEAGLTDYLECPQCKALFDLDDMQQYVDIQMKFIDAFTRINSPYGMSLNRHLLGLRADKW